MEVAVTTGAISRAKLQSNHHHQQTNTQVYYRPDTLPVVPTNSVRALKGNKAMKDYFLKILLTRNIQRQTYAVDSAEGAGTKHAALSKI